nr:MAG TPA: DnaB-like replicative helicase [Caudoviricetes sp.]
MTEQFEILASLEAEQSVLGAILIDNDSANLLTDLTPNNFFSEKNGLIFKTAMSMISDGLPVDVITLDAELGKRGLSEETGGLAYLIDLHQNTPSAANVGRYARLVSESAAERELRFAAEQIERLATERDGRSIADRQAEAVALLDKISGTAAGRSEEMSYEDAIRATLHHWERISETDGMLGFSTGFSNLDEATGGLQRGNLTVIGARPGMGKSVLAENIARHCAKNGLSVRFQSYEMSGVELTQRGASAEYAIDYGRLKKYRMTQTETDNFALYINKARNWKFVIDTEMVGIDAIAARCRLEKRKSGLDLLVVDHLHLMPRKGVNEVAELDDITARLKRLAMELQIHVLLVAQLNRATEKQNDKRPSLADLRGSGGIEQNANLVLMPYREGYYDSEAPQGTAELIIAKNRDGERGVLDLTWEGQYQRFGEYEYYN